MGALPQLRKSASVLSALLLLLPLLAVVAAAAAESGGGAASSTGVEENNNSEDEGVGVDGVAKGARPDAGGALSSSSSLLAGCVAVSSGAGPAAVFGADGVAASWLARPRQEEGSGSGAPGLASPSSSFLFPTRWLGGGQGWLGPTTTGGSGGSGGGGGSDGLPMMTLAAVRVRLAHPSPNRLSVTLTTDGGAAVAASPDLEQQRLAEAGPYTGYVFSLTSA